MTIFSMRRLLGPRLLGRPFGELSALIDLLLDWRRLARERRSLAVLDHWALKDIGLSHADVYRETSKPFWRR